MTEPISLFHAHAHRPKRMRLGRGAAYVLSTWILLISGASSGSRAESALALGRRDNGEWLTGSARGFSDPHGAARFAVYVCGGERSACTVAQSFHDGCAAVAASLDGSRYVAALGDSLAHARDKADAECRAKGPCKIIETVCENDEGADADAHRAGSAKPFDPGMARYIESWRRCFKKPNSPTSIAAATDACAQALAFPQIPRSESDKIEAHRARLSKALELSLPDTTAR
ncbi:DUF4189 domain-containing protein [Methylosinus sp. LW4]|uniref:DUF4189 domain-containing protein n=1 Tax=Methylosinus sp. LW4 TaxID=136993 RepID=UPI0009FE0E51